MEIYFVKSFWEEEYDVRTNGSVYTYLYAESSHSEFIYIYTCAMRSNEKCLMAPILLQIYNLHDAYYVSVLRNDPDLCLCRS